MSTLANPITEFATRTPPRPRRCIPLSLRIFVAVLVLLGVGSILWIGVTIFLPSHREQQTIHEIEWRGGRVTTERVGPEWLRSLVDRDRIKEFSGFEGIVKVSLSDTSVTDVEIAKLSQLKYLRELTFSNSAVTNASWSHLNNVTPLENLNFFGVPISDAGLAKISGCRNLKHLFLDDTAVTETGLSHLGKLTNLQYLRLSRTRVTDVGMAHLCKLTNLEGLYLVGTATTDSALVQLARLPKLKNLVLAETLVTSAGMTHLKGMTQLEYMYVDGDAVTDEGIEELKLALPGCMIDH